MRIQELELCDKDSDWQLARTEFYPDLTLLVGVSGVGKTRILRAISTLRDITQHDGIQEAFWGVQWRTSFVDDDGNEYHWGGKFEDREPRSCRESVSEDVTIDSGYAAQNRTRPRLIEEKLSRCGEPIIQRDLNGIRLHNKQTPKLSPYESALRILSEEDDVSNAYESFSKILFVGDSDDPWPRTLVQGFDKLLQRFDTIDKIRNSGLSTAKKLGLVHERDRDTFERITERFVAVFPHVESVELLCIPVGSDHILQMSIKERGVDKPIPGYKISSGMWRTLMHLARMALWPDGMVVLIDDFENSLGVNCIDFVTDDLIAESRRLQFIITSHHPYIINNIDPRHWKIVVRDGSVVSTCNASEYDLDASSHEAFIKLMNLPAYQEGITVG